MSAGRLILLGLLGLVVAEAAVFLMVARWLGSFTALFALCATSVVGILVLAQMGRRLAGQLADMLARRDAAVMGEVRSSRLLTALGGILLVLPGFITDAVGLLLLIPAVQQKLIDSPGLRRSGPAGRVLELDRSQWHDLPDSHLEDRRPDKGRNRKP